jgi:segregation and condensation protein B
MAMDKPLTLIIEALLFASERPLSAREIHACLPDENLSDIKQALNNLQTEYDAMGRSFVLKEVAQGYQFRTQSEYASYVLQMFKTSPTRLSRAALETLAIIAYKQPILRQEIERIRGVDVGGILKTLLEKGLIRIMGRKNLPGRPLIYGSTNKFLEVFDLKDLESLPKLTEIKNLVAGEEPPVTILEEERQEQAFGNEENTGDKDNQNGEETRSTSET